MRRIALALLGMTVMLSTQAQKKFPQPEDLFADTWVATDGAGRQMPDPAQFPLKTDKPRTVGIFYITWHNSHDGKPYTFDASKRINENPAITRGNPDWPYATYHWGEPEYGYFQSNDEYVCRHDISMLADAGVDVLVMDVTNAVRYWDEWEVLFSTMEEMKKQGNRVPRFCFWAFNGPVISVVQDLYERYYKTPKFQDLWFYWDGKPLMLYNATPEVDANAGGGQHDIKDYSDEVKSFFTLRNMWWGYYNWNGKRYIGTEDNWAFGQDLHTPEVAALSPQERTARHQGRMEEFAVTPAQHPISKVGKSWRLGTGEPKLDQKDMPEPTYVPMLGKEAENPTQYGIYFQDRWDEALQVDPDFLYLNDWNEWTAGKYRQGKDPGGQADLIVDFLGRPENPFYFVDQYNAEFNRTIAPMKGGWTDNYYMQMAQNIRRYKGARAIPVNLGEKTMHVDGDFCEWGELPSYYRDTRDDIAHRDHDGYGDLHYVDTLGRNDILESRVAVDGKNVYFYARTDVTITPCTGQGWMLLYIDADKDSNTGWNGYDYVINQQISDSTHTSLQHWNGTEWTTVRTLRFAQAANELELSVPRSALGLKGDEITFDFKWVDNPVQPIQDVISLATGGDTAPNRRFNYRFIWRKE